MQVVKMLNEWNSWQKEEGGESLRKYKFSYISQVFVQKHGLFHHVALRAASPGQWFTLFSLLRCSDDLLPKGNVCRWINLSKFFIVNLFSDLNCACIEHSFTLKTQVVLRYKLNFHTCTPDSWSCTGNCGNLSQSLSPVKVDESINVWCQTEGIETRLLPNNSALQLV